MSQNSPLESLPVELLTQISNHLHLYDLRRFRMVCRTTAEAVFERMVTIMPKALTVHGKRSEGLMDLGYLGTTFKMKDAITRLTILLMKSEFSYLLSTVRLPRLVYLRLGRGKVKSEDDVIAVLENHKPSLRELRIERISIVSPLWTILNAETQSWRKIAVHLDSSPGFEIRHRVVENIAYCSPDGELERWIVRETQSQRRWEPEPLGKYFLLYAVFVRWWLTRR